MWGYEQIENFVTTKVSEKLSNTPKEEIITPKPNVAGPALEALRYIGHEETLRDLYANLLASSMDSATAASAHPAFVEILKQITPDEAKLLNLLAQQRPFPLLNVRAELKNGKGGVDALVNFSTLGEESNVENLYLVPNYIDNLCRLGLIEVPMFFTYTAENIYEPLENHPKIVELKSQIEADPERKPEIERRGLRVTQLGKQFISACVIDHETKRS